jgi:hypothetical protein
MEDASFAALCQRDLATISALERSEFMTVVLLNLADSVSHEDLWLSIPRWWKMLESLSDFSVAQSKYLARASAHYLKAIRETPQVSFIPLLLNYIAMREVQENVRRLPLIEELEQVLSKTLERGRLSAEDEVWLFERQGRFAVTSRQAQAIASCLSGMPVPNEGDVFALPS